MRARAFCHVEAFHPEPVVVGAIEGDDDELARPGGDIRLCRFFGCCQGGQGDEGGGKDTTQHRQDFRNHGIGETGCRRNAAWM